MSKNVSKADKAIRVILFSVYLAAIISIISLFFKSPKFSLSLFFVSLAYFIIIFAVLSVTKNIHFNVLLKRKTLEKAKSFYHTKFHLAKLSHFRILFTVSIIFLAAVAVYYLLKNSILLAIIVVILAAFTYLYFYVHKVHVVAIKEGLAFDYGEIIALLQWNEIKDYKIKANHVILNLKEKRIKRGFYVDNPKQCESVLKKFIK
ncbi:hypothetical protein KY308_02125 [Candidatus Woesearchaeota archaeon]|nr:hypothetical protein [Candidatus Woesearchaeota archaeon]